MKRLLANCFGIGKIPGAPGTYCSLVPVAIFLVLAALQLSSAWLFSIFLAFLLLGSAVTLFCGKAVSNATGLQDPHELVADEFAGQSLVFLFAAVLPLDNQCAVAVLAFLFFRLFDILKPWPIRTAEKIMGMWGVLLDDLIAGLYAGIMLMLSHHFGLISHFCRVTGMSNGSGLNMFDAVMLGGIQGLTEFLPVSSSGHLVLFETLFDFSPESSGMLLFDLAVHIGTVFAILIVFRKSIRAFFTNLASSSRYGESFSRIYHRSPSVHILVLAAVATLVTGILGFAFENYFKLARGNLAVVALMWLITATLLFVTDLRKRARVGLRDFGIIAAIVVGFSQAAAIMPGISRSGATICAAILLGLHRRWALEFSFLLAIPAIIGAAIVKFITEYSTIQAGLLNPALFLAGMLVAAVTGILALKILIRASRYQNLKYFALYCCLLAFVVFAIYFLR